MAVAPKPWAIKARRADCKAAGGREQAVSTAIHSKQDAESPGFMVFPVCGERKKQFKPWHCVIFNLRKSV